ncbi:uncharacterized protein LOC131659252 [Vicia villosa]|uniref:uncharacterized protein LOC131659252 n=1 Tax=Vicia villosa TaxID=3911 RepID=UPI00273B96F4|nr:uncharacterized protein LOC131659252 [Vicia villosa]
MNYPNQRGLGKRVSKSVRKRVCPYCNLTFNGGKALGGHIKIHLKRRRTYCSKQYHKKSMIAPSSQPEYPDHGEETVDLTKYLSELKWGVGRERIEDLTQYLSGLKWGVKRETYDLTKHLSRGWRLTKSRGKRERLRSKFQLVRCSKEHKMSLKIMERLKRYSLNANFHHIIWNKKVYNCTTCNMNFARFRAVVSHVKEKIESSESYTTVEMLSSREGDKEEQEVTSAAERSLDVVGEKKDEINQGGLQGEELVVHGAHKEPIRGDLAPMRCGMEEEGENTVRGEASKVDDGFKLLKFDLNELPPME